MAKKTIMFVCTGNIFRSQLAEELAKKIFGEMGLVEYKFISAGIHAHDGNSLPQSVINVGRKYGLNLRRKYSKRVKPGMIREVDLILVMEPEHKHEIEEAYPEAKGKVYLITEYVGERGYVEDPIYGRVSVDEVARILQRLITKLAKKLKSEKGKKCFRKYITMKMQVASKAFWTTEVNRL